MKESRNYSEAPPGSRSKAGDKGTNGWRVRLKNHLRTMGYSEGSEALKPGVDSIRCVAAFGVSGAGGPMPFQDRIQNAFGAHDLSKVRTRTGGSAKEAAEALSATAYTTGEDVAFARPPDLHTAAHEAAHVVQQRGGVQLKGGVGSPGDAYERHADAVADKVVRGESAEELLSRVTGQGGTVANHAMQSKAVQFLGTPLDKDLAPDAERPAFGETKGEQRRYSVEQYIAMWEKEQKRKMTQEEKETLYRGCIGITALNLRSGGNPLDAAEKIYGTFEQAHDAMVARNRVLDWLSGLPFVGSLVGKSRYVLFAKLFWSNQSPDWEDRLKPDEKAFRPDPRTGEVDMSDYAYHARSRWKTDPSTGERMRWSYVNFDYGFWDEASQSFWHANHKQYKVPKKAAENPMIVYQSTKEKFTKGYIDFDRIVFCIARAENYDPRLAAIAYAGEVDHD